MPGFVDNVRRVIIPRMPEIQGFAGKTYIVVVQCDIVMQRCPGFYCERAFFGRNGGFAGLGEQPCRMVYLTCGGCCGRALNRKLALLVQKAQKTDQIQPAQILVKFSTCITKDNHHGPKCPHLDYMTQLVDKLHLDYSFDTHISTKAEQRRAEGIYRA